MPRTRCLTSPVSSIRPRTSPMLPLSALELMSLACVTTTSAARMVHYLTQVAIRLSPYSSVQQSQKPTAGQLASVATRPRSYILIGSSMKQARRLRHPRLIVTKRLRPLARRVFPSQCVRSYNAMVAASIVTTSPTSMRRRSCPAPDLTFMLKRSALGSHLLLSSPLVWVLCPKPWIASRRPLSTSSCLHPTSTRPRLI